MRICLICFVKAGRIEHACKLADGIVDKRQGSSGEGSDSDD